MDDVVRDGERNSGRLFRRLPVLLGLVFAAGGALAQDYPSRPIRFLVGYAPGTGTDIVSRLLGHKFSERFGQPVVVEQRVGSGGIIANEAVIKAPPDGHTMVLLSGAHPATAAVRLKLPYDPVKDFAMVGTVASYPIVISVRPDSPIKSFPNLLARAKAAPGRLTYSMGSTGSLLHLLGEWISIEAGTSMVHVPFKGSGPALIELLGGRIDLMVDTGIFAFGQIRGGKIRPLAISSPARYPLMPDVPTIAETLPGVEMGSWLGLVVTPGTPRPIVDRLNRELRSILGDADVRRRLAEMATVPLASSPEEMSARIERETARWKRVVELKNIERE